MKIKKLFLVGIAALAMTACSNNDEYSLSNDDNVIRLKAGIEGMNTRAAGSSFGLQNTEFVVGENINVYFTKTIGGTKLDGIVGDYLTYTVEDLWQLSTTTPVQYPSDSNVEVYALYPSTVTKSTSIFSVQNNQTEDTDYRKSDLMYAIASNKAKSDGAISLNFKHCLSKVILKIDAGTSELDPTDATDICLDGVYQSININHGADGITLGSVANYRGSIELGDYDANGVCAIVVPQTVTEGEMLFDFMIGTSNFIVYAGPGIEFKPNSVHTITVTLNNENISVTSYSITNWDTGTNYTGGANIEIF